MHSILPCPVPQFSGPAIQSTNTFLLSQSGQISAIWSLDFYSTRKRQQSACRVESNLNVSCSFSVVLWPLADLCGNKEPCCCAGLLWPQQTSTVWYLDLHSTGRREEGDGCGIAFCCRPMGQVSVILLPGEWWVGMGECWVSLSQVLVRGHFLKPFLSTCVLDHRDSWNCFIISCT